MILSLFRIRLTVLSLVVIAAAAGCAKTPTGSATLTATPTGTTMNPAPSGNACDRNLITKADVATLLSEPIATVEPLKGDPQSCVFTTTGFSSVIVSLRPGVGDTTVDAWLAGKMNVPATAAPGIGDKASWTPMLKELNASRGNLLCDIGATGPASGGATQEKVVALCAKIFAAS